MSAQRQYEPAEVADAIRRADGVVRDAAKLLGCSHETVYDYIRNFEVCEEAKAEAKKRLVDLSRSTLRGAMQAGDVDAAKHVSRHYDDDAKTRQDITSNDETVGQPPAAIAELTVEQLRALADDPDTTDD